MQCQFVMCTAKYVKASMNVKALLTMSKKSIAQYISPSLGQKFEQSQPITDEDLSDFKQYTSTYCPLVITSRKDNQKMIFSLRIPDNFIITLRETKPLLPQHAPHSGRRCDYKTCNCCLCMKYAKHSFISAHSLEDGQAPKDWLTGEAPRFKYLSEVLKHLDLYSYEHMTNHSCVDSLPLYKARSLTLKPCPGHDASDQGVPLHKVAGIWYGLAITCNQDYSRILNRDTPDVKHSLNCVIP